MDNLPGADHAFIICAYPPKPLTSDKWLYTIIKKLILYFKELLSRVPWDQLDFHSDIENAWTCWKDLFFSVVDSVVPTTR